MADQNASKPPAAVLLGREVIASDPLSGAVTVRFFARSDFANRYGSVQGGLLAAMLDSAAGNAVFAALEPPKTAVTVQLTTRFHKPASLGVLMARAHVVSRNDKSVLVEAYLTDEKDVLVASATAEFRIRTPPQ